MSTRHLRIVAGLEEPRTCTCRDCGRVFIYGTEDDNEEFCQRCVYLAMVDGEEYPFDEADHETR